MKEKGVLGLVGLMVIATLLFSSCIREKECPSPAQKKSFEVEAYIHYGDGSVVKLDKGINLRAPKEQNGARIVGLGQYYHNQQCELGINPVNSKVKVVDYVLFDKGSNIPVSILPTTVMEYKSRNKPANPHGYAVNFVFNVTSNINMHVYMKKVDPGVEVGIDDGK
ncbi:hypothetical protein [Porphyromonas levii]|uniref:hypothetical protein n=1 Tax=Porphyromonas levii TaxID=28114 RepID=UPI001B8A8E8F|nr:hypothetical protein [Porphyromonas levii]MBR8712237.1 hypothetical protein [Porphyromonas levii]MBR8714297.1 hypothetical protein [Porphyromonas levii]MBR8726838.1 hypothetical protein [Porphyromonas levii]MBR8735145.1 hypothetical protein [Porphyromonas levii]MBR8777246.1 hypothetical protein [Porphyromonas levii]